MNIRHFNARGLVAFWSSLAMLLLILAPGMAEAQLMPRAHLNWRTLHTEHFDVHYPVELTDWTRATVSRIEAVHARVSALVGNAPGTRITIIVEDPMNVANSAALTMVDRAVIYLWPNPQPAPFAGGRGFPEVLAVHEFTHSAQLSRPSRNRRQRVLGRLAPYAFGPLKKMPDWATEGYATYVEGKLTGSGRPHGAFRPAVLRQWALEGKLPSYAELDRTGAFFQEQMPYLAGSAFLEWLVDEKGDSSLVHLWRRMSARQSRSFEDAFAGVYGGYPADLYDRFTVDLTQRALQVRDTLAAAGLVVGDTVQALSWYTGNPAISPDGDHIAIPLRSPTQPTRVVVWKTTEEPDSAAEKARQKALERDPEDVPAIEWRPRAKKPVATLDAFSGRGYSAPRFLPEGKELLLTRWAPLADGAVRPDLFVWNWKTGTVRRITRGAAVRDGDPSPDGTSAVAVRCLHGNCDLVRVDLASGAVSVLAAGSVDRAYSHPRWAPDGKSVVASMQEKGLWRLVRVDARGGMPRPLGPVDGANRYDAAWTPRGHLVAVSEAGGVANLVQLDSNTGKERPLTRVTGAASAPAPHPDGSVYFLNLNPRGYALHRIHPDSVRPGATVTLSPQLSPAAPRPATAPVDTFARAELPADRPYGLGPQHLRWLPGLAFTSEGEGGTLALVAMDPVGRFTALLQGSYGTGGIWRGAGLAVVYRGMRPTVAADLFWAEQSPSAQYGGFLPERDARYRGGAISAEQRWSTSTGARMLRVGASTGILETPVTDGARQLVFAEAGWRMRRTSGASSLSGELELHGTGGRTSRDGWSRGIVRLGLAAGNPRIGLRLDGSYGLTGADAPLWERFSVGGSPVTLFDASLLSQRVTMPGLPVGAVTGERMLTGRATLPLGPLSPFLWAANPEASSKGWYRVLGIENTIAIPMHPLAGLPAVQITGGVLYPLDEPFQKQLRAYLLLGFRP